MAGKFCELGQLVKDDPGAAYKKLVQLYKTHSTRRAVAYELDVNEGTVGRWLRTLECDGYGDPRVAVPQK